MMDHHELLALEIREAITNGNRRGAHRFATSLARTRMSVALTDDEQALLSMRAASMKVADAALQDDEDVAVVADRFGELLKVCARCHQKATAKTRREPQQAAPPLPPQPTSRMKRQTWAMDRLWEGLVFNSDIRWRQGADALAADRHLTSDVQAAAAAAARAATSINERSELYAKLLASCATCHERARR